MTQLRDLPRQTNAVSDLLLRHLDQGRGRKVAIIDDFGAVTYAELADRAGRVATLLEQRGVQPEQRVLMCMHDTRDFPAVFLGALMAGIVPVPVNTLLTTEDYRQLVEDSRARLVFVSEPLLESFERAIEPLGRRPEIVRVRSPLSASPSSEPTLDDLLASATPRTEHAPTTPDDIAFWLYSSGSTGAPKGTMHLHSNLLRTAELYAAHVLGIRESDIVFSAAKLFFAYGLGAGLTFPFSVGATAVLMAERPTPEAVAKRLTDHQATIFAAVPTLFGSLLNQEVPDPQQTRLRLCTSAGEALPKHLGDRWQDRYGVEILDGIGSTEMLHIFLSNRPGDVVYGTTGRAVPGYELELRSEDGSHAREEGVLWVRGPTSAQGYWNRREKSLSTFHGPWTNTGDRFTRNEEGRYTYAGRADDMLKVSGIWVSPFEVESAIAAHDAVLEAAVVGREDDSGLIKPQAFVVLKDPSAASPELSDALKQHVKARLAPYKYPRWIEFVESLPKTATGKIQRFLLRSRAT